VALTVRSLALTNKPVAEGYVHGAPIKNSLLGKFYISAIIAGFSHNLQFLQRRIQANMLKISLQYLV